MEKLLIKGLVAAFVGSLMMVGSVLATPLSYWHQTSSNSEFVKLSASAADIEFGYYQVDSKLTPNIDTVTLTTLFDANGIVPDFAQISGPLVPNFFGFYFLDTTDKEIWLSDANLLGTASTGTDLAGLAVQTSDERFQIFDTVLDNFWIFQFTDDNGNQVAFQTADDISPVPEPAAMLLFGTGLIGLAGAVRRKKAQK